MRLVGFISRMLVGIVIGFALGVLWTEGKLHFPIAKAATIDPYLRTPGGSPISPGIVDLDYSATDFAASTTYYKFSVNVDHNPYKYSTTCLTTDPGTITGELEITADPGEYTSPQLTEYTDSGCTVNNGSTVFDDSFTVVASTSTSTPSSALTGKDTLFLWGVALFLLAYPVWSRVFSV